MFKINSVRLACLAILFAFTVAGVGSLALAQSAVTGAIGGAATDQNNAAVANATVTLQSADTNKTETATTDNEGRFRFTNLQPGTYTITISASGFSEFKQEKIIVEVGRVTNLDAALRVGAAAAAVEIVSGGGAVNLESKDFTTNINQTAINELPINGRRWSDFALLTPGSVPDQTFGLISFRGISGLLNNNTVDGGDNNQAFFSEERGRTRINYSISESAIREFQVNTSNYSAEYGRSAGGVTNAVIKSGTNQFHGDGFYFNRNSNLGARPPLAFQSVLVNGFATTQGIKLDDVRHQFGGTLGGPIVKDKLFFFFSYDQQKRDFPGVAAFSSPGYLNSINRTALLGRGLTGAQIDSALNFLNSETGPVPRRGDQKLALPKIDWQINNANSFSITYNRLHWNSPAGIQTQPVVTRGVTSFGDDFVKIDWGTARLLSTINPRLINEFRVQIARDFEYEFSQTPLAGEPRTALNGSAPDVFLTNGLEFGKATFLERPKYPDERREQFVDNMTYSLGANTLKFGVDINHVRDILANLRNESGAYSYNNINDFVIDYVNFLTPLPSTVPCVNATGFAGKCYTSQFQQGFGPQGAELSTNDYGAFIQYDWKFLPRLTLNLGMRYEYEQYPDPQIPSSSTAVIPNIGRTLAQATSFMPSDTNNFGPRIGFAADLTGDGKTALRAGYGIYYGRAINSTIYNALINTGNPAGQTQVSIANTAANAPIFPNVLTSAPAGTASLQFFAKDFGNPLIQQVDLSIQRELGRNFTVSASYLGSFGQGLPTFYDRNLSQPNATQVIPIVGGPFGGQSLTVPLFPTARPLSGFGALTEIASKVKSQYNAFVVEANHRFSEGFQLQSSYTLSKATDDLQTSTTFTAQNIPVNVFDPEADDGTSNYDRRHKFVLAMIYAPRFKSDNKLATALLDGWSIAPIYKLFSGVAYDAGVSGSNGGAGSLNRSGGTNRLFGLVDRNAFTGPTQNIFDLRLSRRFYIKEKADAEFLVEAFNLPNTTIATGINSTMYNFSSTTRTLTFNIPFGTITQADSTLFRERQIQIGIRFHF
ncbi:MAG: TonB-dependent receptor [Blastocatellia bacterium]|nr:TonB-dependent receptor [Blastocatellia bacterium]